MSLCLCANIDAISPSITTLLKLFDESPSGLISATVKINSLENEDIFVRVRYKYSQTTFGPPYMLQYWFLFVASLLSFVQISSRSISTSTTSALRFFLGLTILACYFHSPYPPVHSILIHSYRVSKPSELLFLIFCASYLFFSSYVWLAYVPRCCLLVSFVCSLNCILSYL